MLDAPAPLKFLCELLNLCVGQLNACLFRLLQALAFYGARVFLFLPLPLEVIQGS